MLMILMLILITSVTRISAAGLLIPLYVWPTISTSNGNVCTSTDYIKVATNAAASKTIAIVNPNNGPNYADGWAKLSYDTCIQYLKSNGVEVIGYIHTKVGYPNISGYRTDTDVKSDIDKWKNEFDVDGIFIDECSNRWYPSFDSQATATSFYQDIVNYVINTKSYGRAVLNPGSPYHEGIIAPYYGNTKVIVVVFESSQDNYQPPNNSCRSNAKGSFSPGPFCPYVPISDGIEPLRNSMMSGLITKNQSSAMLYSASSDAAKVREAIIIGDNKHIGWHYVLDASPWNSTPSNTAMNAQAAAVVELNSNTVVVSQRPSNNPSTVPSILPSSKPSITPSITPSSTPSVSPTYKPSVIPSTPPSPKPSNVPSISLTKTGSQIPSKTLTARPTRLSSSEPTNYKSSNPTGSPTVTQTIDTTTFSVTIFFFMNVDQSMLANATMEQLLKSITSGIEAFLLTSQLGSTFVSLVVVVNLYSDYDGSSNRKLESGNHTSLKFTAAIESVVNIGVATDTIGDLIVNEMERDTEVLFYHIVQNMDNNFDGLGSLAVSLFDFDLTIIPTDEPSTIPVDFPSTTPTYHSSLRPSLYPTNQTTRKVLAPSGSPSKRALSSHPSEVLTYVPSEAPSRPTQEFSTSSPSSTQTILPSSSATVFISKTSLNPSFDPGSIETSAPNVNSEKPSSSAWTHALIFETKIPLFLLPLFLILFP